MWLVRYRKTPYEVVNFKGLYQEFRSISEYNIGKPCITSNQHSRPESKRSNIGNMQRQILTTCAKGLITWWVSAWVDISMGQVNCKPSFKLNLSHVVQLKTPSAHFLAAKAKTWLQFYEVFIPFAWAEISSLICEGER